LELRVITALSLISTLYISPQHPLSLLQPDVSSTAVSWKRRLTVKILQLSALRSSCHSRPCRTLVNSLNPNCQLSATCSSFNSSHQRHSHIAIDGQSVSKFWCRAPSGAHDRIVITLSQLLSFFLWGALSDERTGLSVVYAAGFASAAFLGSESLGTCDHILLSQI
jgi:hypothetical protein